MARLDESRIGEPAGPAPTKPTTVTKATTPYDPRSGNTPDYVAPEMQTTDEAKSTIQAALDAAAQSEFAAKWKPVATIITQNGEEVQVDSSGRSSDGSIPFGTTKAKTTTTGTGTGTLGAGGGTGVTGSIITASTVTGSIWYDTGASSTPICL